jgi:hypothetical protein
MILSDVSIDIDQVECSAKYASHWPYVQDTPSCPCDVWLSVINQLSSSSSILLRFASNDGWIAPVVCLHLPSPCKLSSYSQFFLFFLFFLYDFTILFLNKLVIIWGLQYGIPRANSTTSDCWIEYTFYIPSLEYLNLLRRLLNLTWLWRVGFGSGFSYIWMFRKSPWLSCAKEEELNSLQKKEHRSNHLWLFLSRMDGYCILSYRNQMKTLLN